MLVNNRWVRASGDLNGKPISIQYREDWQLAADTDDYGVCVQIAWHADSQDESTGFPAADEQDQILAFHQALQDQLEPGENALVAMMITHDAINQWIIYCKNLDAMKAALDEIPTEQGLYPIEVVADEDADWRIFRQVYDVIRQQEQP